MELYRHAGRMKMKQNRAGEVEYLTFPLLEQTGIVRHLFTTRLGGVSQGVCSSMNLSYARGDEKEAVDENFRRIAGVLGCGPEDIVCGWSPDRTAAKESCGPEITMISTVC